MVITTIVPTTTLVPPCLDCEQQTIIPTPCGNTTKVFTTTTVVCSINVKDVSLSMKCTPGISLPFLNAEICGAYGQEILYFQVSDNSIASTDGTVMLGEAKIVTNDKIYPQDWGRLVFERVSTAPKSVSFKLKAITTCGTSAEFTVTIDMQCTCEDANPCSTCDGCA